MNTWIELEPTYLTNQPAIWVGRGKARKRVGDPDVEPTEAFLFTYECRQTKRGVKRKRTVRVLKGQNAKDLEKQIIEFCELSYVRLQDSAHTNE
jgi:hypothetical protein